MAKGDSQRQATFILKTAKVTPCWPLDLTYYRFCLFLFPLQSVVPAFVELSEAQEGGSSKNMAAGELHAKSFSGQLLATAGKPLTITSFSFIGPTLNQSNALPAPFPP